MLIYDPFPRDYSQQRLHYNPKTKGESLFEFLKTNMLQITVSVIGTVVAAIIILLSINLNREVGEISQQVKFNDKYITEIKEEIKNLNKLNDETHKYATDIEILKERMRNLSNNDKAK